MNWVKLHELLQDCRFPSVILQLPPRLFATWTVRNLSTVSFGSHPVLYVALYVVLYIVLYNSVHCVCDKRALRRCSENFQ